MMKKLNLLSIFLLLLFAKAYSQTADTSAIKKAFIKSKWNLASRSFFMASINEKALKDDYAFAVGAGLAYSTGSFHGFQLHFSGYAWYNLFSSNIYDVDEQTLQNNRYEIGLFDIDYATKQRSFSRIEESYIKFTHLKTTISAGNLNLNTPFINSQDGRMRPTLAQGIWLNTKLLKNISFSGGYIWSILPRSTTRTYAVSKSIGIYPMGVTETGAKANYRNNIEGCTGLAIANIAYSVNPHFGINAWNLFVENVMNTALVEVLATKSLPRATLNAGIMYVHQQAINNGGNADQTLAYTTKNEQANALSAQLGLTKGKNILSINYTHITGDGRYLMPREWGRDVFYTFLLRERNEGFGNLHAGSIKLNYALSKKIQTLIAYGIYILPSTTNYRLNKYGMPSYQQFNLGCNYDGSALLNGLAFRFLAVYKANAGETFNNLKYVYNKVNMFNLNFIVDYKL